ncbi:o-methyltransferas-like protein [Patellaria atrata CBS 101060]|uniref:O-methyltransferas-like protein n=1 Tax=Patellaria atrata CBS 101060 TaxID=1346257 RepID=A0A9P4S6Z4_9PEZI|nr:o-methyltransferas-like protein [Patellaria atrata CBS 101060]
MNTPDAVAQQNAAIQASLEHFTSGVKSYSHISTQNAGKTGIQESCEVAAAHTSLVLDAVNLLRAVKGPVDMVFSHFENAAHTGAVRALLEMGVFHALPMDESSMTATELAEKLNVNKLLLVRLMRAATPAGPFKEVGVEEYAHTPYSKLYLVPELGGVFKLMIDEYMPPKAKLYEFLKETKWQNPESEQSNPYTFAHRTDGETMWEHMAHFPDREKMFNFGMQAQTAATNWTIAIYPWVEALKDLESTEDSILVVDVGGGKGHASKQIRQFLGEKKGKVILQDRPSVIADISEELPGVERMGYDFFTPQPIQGAFIYYIRRCLHDWSDTSCTTILSTIAKAMSPSSRLVIAEMVIPEQGAGLEAAWYDITMMTLNGRERTRKDFEQILEPAGLRISNVITVPGTNYGVVEARLAEAGNGN